MRKRWCDLSKRLGRMEDGRRHCCISRRQSSPWWSQENSDRTDFQDAVGAGPYFSPGRLFFVTALFSFLMGIVGCTIDSSSLDTNLDSLLNDLHKRLNLIRQLRVDFTKTRHSSAFKAAVSVKGTLIYQKPDKFLMTYQGGVNVHILSNGDVARIVHDNTFGETFVLNGHLSTGIFCDPWIDLITTIGKGGFDKLFSVALAKKKELIELDFATRNQKPFEYVNRMILWTTHLGEIKRITVEFSDGDFDEINFDSWAILLDSDPEILDLEARLEGLSVK